jgi:hypothetical protein
LAVSRDTYDSGVSPSNEREILERTVHAIAERARDAYRVVEEAHQADPRDESGLTAHAKGLRMELLQTKAELKPRVPACPHGAASRWSRRSRGTPSRKWHEPDRTCDELLGHGTSQSHPELQIVGKDQADDAAGRADVVLQDLGTPGPDEPVHEGNAHRPERGFRNIYPILGAMLAKAVPVMGHDTPPSSGRKASVTVCPLDPDG